MGARRQGITRWIGAGLLLGSLGCGDNGDDAGNGTPDIPDVPTGSAVGTLSRASDCSDLLTKIQNDAIAKVRMVVQREKVLAPMRIAGDVPTDDVGSPIPGTVRDAGISAPSVPRDEATAGGDPVNGGGSFDDGEAAGSDNDAKDPIGASETNRQVGDVDEADFVKVVESGKGIFLLHGNTLRKLKSWPAAETALVGKPLVIEGTPSEMFVTDEGRAVVFSSVYGYGTTPGYGGSEWGATDAIAPGICAPDYGCKGGYGTQLKITVADVGGAEPKVLRELYYEGNYVSSRRYDGSDADVVRAIVQASAKFSGLYAADIEWRDAWGRAYDEANIAAQLDEWETRTIASIRKTTLDEWLPSAQERKGTELVELERTCDAYFVPEAGMSEHGLTHVLTLDVARPTDRVSGVTIVGATSTVYSNAQRLVLAQPDYRWIGSSADFGIASLQQTALHLFELSGAGTKYVASGLVPGQLPLRNPQFGIDVAADGTVRVATTGFVRDDPKAERDEPAFWRQHTENQVVTARANGNKLAILGKAEKLGHERESIYSARFIGDRAYVVTFEQKDPLIVVDLQKPETPTVLGEIEIPGFSEYVHPLDATHLLTAGQSASRGIQLQIFDVANPKSIPQPKVLDFGSGSSSEVSYDHKAFTFYEGVLAMPLSSYGSGFRAQYKSGLALVKVDAATGFQELGFIDHAPLYADNGAGTACGKCDPSGCYEYVCSYAPQVRRGHFVESEQTTYVYSFSFAGVLVNDLAKLSTPVARVGLPAPVYDGGSWAGGGRDGGVGVVPTQDAGSPRPPTATDAGVAMPVPDAPPVATDSDKPTS